MNKRLPQLAMIALGLATLSLHAQVLDRVVASVNGKPILLSRVDEQARLAAFIEGRDPNSLAAQDRAQALERLINQALIREQIARAQFTATDSDVDARMQEARKLMNAASDAAWREALSRYGIDEPLVKQYLRAQVEEMQFVEARFRPTVKVTPQQIEDFYQTEYLPKLRERGARELPLNEVRAQIEQVVTERAVTAALAAWLQSLRAQNNIHVLVMFSSEGAARSEQRAPDKP